MFGPDNFSFYRDRRLLFTSSLSESDYKVFPRTLAFFPQALGLLGVVSSVCFAHF